MAGEDGPSCWRRRRGMGLAVAALLCCLAGTARGDFEADQKECADTLTGLLTCLEYVEGTSKAPPPDCCSGLNQIVTKNLRCLCILIKDRNDPQMPFKVNATRARSLPGACKNPIDIFQCIDLLKLNPNSTEAQIFKQPISPSSNTTVIKPPSSSNNSSSGGASADPPTGGVGAERRPAVGLWAFSALVLSLEIFGG